jgi:uncharacterized protein YjbI with pentapeptide repeats
MEFLGKLSFRFGAQYLAIDNQGKLTVANLSPGDPAGIFLAYDVGNGQFCLQACNGNWLLLIDEISPNAWYPVLMSTGTGAFTYCNRFYKDRLNFQTGEATLFWAGFSGFNVGLLYNPDSINPYCKCNFDVSVNWGGTALGLNLLTPGALAIQKNWSCIGGDFTCAGRACVDLSGIEFTSVDFRDSIFTGAFLRGTKFTLCNLLNTRFGGADLRSTQFISSVLAGTDFSNADLTRGATFTPQPPFSGTPDMLTRFNNARLDLSVIKKDWSFIDLSGATISDLNSSVDLSGLQAKYTVAKGIVLSEIKLRNANFSNADLTGTSLNRADLTGAILLSTLLNGANLSHAILESANLTSAQFGAIIQQSILEPQYEPHLASGNLSALAKHFHDNALPLTSSHTIAVIDEDRVWEIRDEDKNLVYIIRRDPSADGSLRLIVYTETAAANMTDAYMPNAVLTNANLYAVNASGIQFYGENSKLNNLAILENANFASANFGSLDMQTAHMRGVIFDYANLVNAKLKGADLTKSASGKNASLAHANLQGADFSDAYLMGANLSDAAIALDLANNKVTLKQQYTTDTDPGGVYLFSLLATFQQELNDAAEIFSLNPNGNQTDFQTYLTALDSKTLPLLQQRFQREGGVSLSSSAQISTIEQRQVWKIVVNQSVAYTVWAALDVEGFNELYVKPSQANTRIFSLNPGGDRTLFNKYETALGTGDITTLQPPFTQNGHNLPADALILTAQQGIVWNISDSPTSYTVWAGLDFSNNYQLYVRPSIEAIHEQFYQNGYNLRWQTTVNIAEAGVWLLDNDSQNPQNFDIGYMTLTVFLNGSSLDVHGTSLHIERLSSKNQLEIVTAACNATTLNVSDSSMDDSTVCPNSYTRGVNKVTDPDVVNWMKAPQLAAPPECVPTDYSYCPPSSTSQEIKNRVASQKTDRMHNRSRPPKRT